MLELEKQFARQLLTHKNGIHSLALVRYFGCWKKSQQKALAPILERRPWMTFQSAFLLDKNLSPGDSVFEYGGGGSTLYFLDRGAKVVTVEDAPDWYMLLTEKIKEDGLAKNWTGLLKAPAPPVMPGENDASDPDCYTSNSKKYRNYDFTDYVRAIDHYPDRSFDIVVVDGRSRPSCIKHAVDKVKVEGYLVLDNTERDYYLREKTLRHLVNFKVILDEFGPTPGLPWFTKTTVWRRVQ